MFASTLININQTQALVDEMEKNEELERQLQRRKQMTEEEFAQECANKKYKKELISQTFANIRNILLPYEKNETVLATVFQDLQHSINCFEAELIQEVTDDYEKSDHSLKTARKLEETVRKTVDPIVNLDSKAKSVNEFYNHARNGKLSVVAKCILGGIIGGLTTAAAFIGGLAAGGALSFLFSGPIGMCVGITMISFMAVYGALSGVRMALACSKNQDDSRGHKVSKNLHTLITERHRLFPPKKMIPDEDISTNHKLKCCAP